jgi:hypothetical protein
VEGELRLTFRGTFSEQMVMSWEEMKSVVKQVYVGEDPDALIWGV